MGDPPDAGGHHLPWLCDKRLKLFAAENLDSSPPSTHYSSCGEKIVQYDDSDCDRANGYSSANSLGTPTVCSSFGTCNDFLDSEVGSVRNMSFHEDNNLEQFETGYETEGSPLRSFTRSSRKFNKFFYRKGKPFFNPKSNPGNPEINARVECLDKQVDAFSAEHVKTRAPFTKPKGLLNGGEETLECTDLNRSVQPLDDNQINNNAANGTLVQKLQTTLASVNYVDPLRSKTLQEYLGSSENGAIDCLNEKENGHGQPDSLGCQTEHNFGGEREIRESQQLDQMPQPLMEGYQEVRSMPFNGGCCLSKHLRETTSEHDHEVGDESVCETVLSARNADNLELSSVSEKFSDFNSQSEFDSILGDVTDEEDAFHLSERNMSLCSATSWKEIDRDNPLLLNSKVVFGVGDWDEFVQEVEGNDMRVAFLEDKVQKVHPHFVDSESVYMETAEAREDTGDALELKLEDMSSSFAVVAAKLAYENMLRTPFNKGNPCSSSGSGRPDLEEDEGQEFMSAMEDVRKIDEFHSNSRDSGKSYVRKTNYTGGDAGLPSKLTNCSTDFHLEEEEEERNLRLQKPHIEAFYPESQDTNKDILLLEASQLKVQDIVYEKDLECLSDEEVEKKTKNYSKFDDHPALQAAIEAGLSSGPLSDFNTKYVSKTESEKFVDKTLRVQGNSESVLPRTSTSRDIFSCVTCPDTIAKDARDWGKEDLGPDELSRYVEALDVNESYVDTIHDMEDVLLDSGENGGARFVHANRGFSTQSSRGYRDEVSRASTSDVGNAHSNMQYFQKLNQIEVVGAKQRKGGASFGERLVGVKEYTVYQIRVQSGRNQWEVERRYRDFLGLYHQLKRMFAAQSGADLPSPWQYVERESRNIFGNASPSVVKERSALIQECLQSLLQAGSPFDSSPSLFWFLLPHRSFSDTFAALEGQAPENIQKSKEKGPDFQFQEVSSPTSHAGLVVNEYRQGGGEEVSAFGKTIRLIVQIHPHKSLKQLLEAQHYSCAGCYKHLDVAKGLMQGFAQTFGWGNPRLCEYMGQVFCTSCHSNETAVLPGRVLQLWDFTPCPVSQIAKAYLDSIYDRPMLCVSAVNPFIFSKVPVLVNVMENRKKLSKMLSCIHCPSRASIQRSLGSRRYLLESSDFFALRDLVDLSKGAFAALPSLMEAVSKKIYMHITQQCSICREVGESCGAQLKCEKSSLLIFPFQEGEVIRCDSCGLVFHESCFRKLSGCPCKCTENEHDRHGKLAFLDKLDVKSHLQSDSSGKLKDSVDPYLGKQGSTSSKGLFIDLFQKASLDNIWKPRKNSGVLNMGSLSSPLGL
eukprot:Gb_37964 [translate_table: standard]